MHPGCPIDQVYLYTVPIDFRKAIDGLSVLVEQELGLNPFASALYVFTNRHRNKIKALYWHRNGFCLWQKRLERDKFVWPADANPLTHTGTHSCDFRRRYIAEIFANKLTVVLFAWGAFRNSFNNLKISQNATLRSLDGLVGH